MADLWRIVADLIIIHVYIFVEDQWIIVHVIN